MAKARGLQVDTRDLQVAGAEAGRASPLPEILEPSLSRAAPEDRPGAGIGVCVLRGDGSAMAFESESTWRSRLRRGSRVDTGGLRRGRKRGAPRHPEVGGCGSASDLLLTQVESHATLHP